MLLIVRLPILGMMGQFCCLSRSTEFGGNKMIDVPVRWYGDDDAGSLSICFHHEDLVALKVSWCWCADQSLCFGFGA